MKHILTFKTPDALEQIEDESEAEQLKVINIMKPYLEYSEYVYLEVDTENKTVRLIEK